MFLDCSVQGYVRTERHPCPNPQLFIFSWNVSLASTERKKDHTMLVCGVIFLNSTPKTPTPWGQRVSLSALGTYTKTQGKKQILLC